VWGSQVRPFVGQRESDVVLDVKSMKKGVLIGEGGGGLMVT